MSAHVAQSSTETVEPQSLDACAKHVPRIYSLALRIFRNNPRTTNDTIAASCCSLDHSNTLTTSASIQSFTLTLTAATSHAPSFHHHRSASHTLDPNRAHAPHRGSAVCEAGVLLSTPSSAHCLNHSVHCCITPSSTAQLSSSVHVSVLPSSHLLAHQSADLCVRSLHASTSTDGSAVVDHWHSR